MHFLQRTIMFAAGLLAMAAALPAAAQSGLPGSGVAGPRAPRSGEEAVRVEWSVVGQAVPGGTVRVAATFRIHRGWHIYWMNPGESGAATRLSIDLPEGCRLVEGSGKRPRIDFPCPTVLRHAETTIGYEGEVTLSFAVVLPDEIPAAGLVAGVSADWLVCRTTCLLGSNKSSVDLAKPVDPADPAVARLERSLRAVPTALPAGWRASIERTGAETAILSIEMPDALSGRPATYLPGEEGAVSLEAGYVADGTGPSLRVPLTIPPDGSDGTASGASPRVRGVIVVDGGRVAHTIDLPVPGNRPDS